MIDDAASRVLQSCSAVPWSGIVWRAHSRRYSAIDPGGSLRGSGRYHRGADYFPPEQAFAVLYTSVSDAVVTWEIIRGSMRGRAGAVGSRLRAVNLAKLRVRLHAVLDLRDPIPSGLARAALTSDNYSLTQAIGSAAFARGLEGLLVPSATGVGEPGDNYNVIILMANLRPGSEVSFIESTRPNLPP